MKDLLEKKTDVLVVGGGGAGCRAAIEAASLGCRVFLVSKFPLGKSGATVVAESFYSAPIGEKDPTDGPEPYLKDIIDGGCLLSDQKLAQRLAYEGNERVEDLRRYGVQFKKAQDGKLLQMKGPGHSLPRALAPVGGGLGLMRGLQKELKKHPQIELLEDAVITKVLTEHETVAGAAGLDLRTGRPFVVNSKAVILATGGYSALWSYNDVPCDCNGDGIAMAYFAGADLIDMEMALFYPTVVIHPPFLYGLEIPHGLLVEQVKGKILNGRFEEFVPGEIPTRDVMVSLIYAELAKGNGTPHGGVYLDLSRDSRPKEELHSSLMTYLPEKYKYLLKHGIDITREPLEVAPMAHYTLGGVKIDRNCKTRVGGLFAAGEAAGGVHGANRLAGNALPDTQVFGAVAGDMAARFTRERDALAVDRRELEEEVRRIESLLQPKANGLQPSQLKADLQNLMWNKVGINREGEGLGEAVTAIEKMKHEDLPRLIVPEVREFNLAWLEALDVFNMLELADMTARAALMREETRGHQFRLDFPQKDDENWLKHIVFRKENGEMESWTEPVSGKAD